MKTHAYTSPLSISRRGFSLFEVLMFIAILGVMVSLAVPMLFQHDSIYAARDRRNAQELAATCMMAQAAGLEFVQEESVMETLRALVRGGMPAQGALKGRVFVVPGLSEEDLQGAAKYLELQNGELRYTQGETAHMPGEQRM
jgi:prepilin-type N-terminal cleavage/methylation domain-containing protein